MLRLPQRDGVGVAVLLTDLGLGDVAVDGAVEQAQRADDLAEEKRILIKGRDLVAGLPRTIEMTSEEVREAMHEPITAIVEAVKVTLERTPPELASDIFDAGITLAGGAAQLRGIDTLLAAETGLPVRVCENPETAIVLGTGKQLDSIHLMQQISIKQGWSRQASDTSRIGHL